MTRSQQGPVTRKSRQANLISFVLAAQRTASAAAVIYLDFCRASEGASRDDLPSRKMWLGWDGMAEPELQEG